uniref:Reverse transcriptase zinc-binding domain-containing protein n=1 Tax=Aegilops tauschii subsp. strangulata TaxID=200361 RepID=A0A453RC20_AEGTS
MFSPNTSALARQGVKDALQIHSENWNEKYLGLPVHVGKSRKKAFAFVKNVISGKVYGWKERLIAKTGKETLVTSVAQAIPTFAMSCFYLTKTFCDELSSLIGNYWWSQQDKEHTTHWIGWNKLTLPKAQGGLGFRDMHAFNVAMLSRQAWRLIQHPYSLCAHILKAKYYPDGRLLEAQSAAGISYAWRSLLHGAQLVREGYIWRIGDGADVNIWTDPWIPRSWSRTVITPRGQCLLQRVSELIDPFSASWDEQLVRDTFWPDDVVHILRIPLREGAQDFMAWQYDTKGAHSVKSAYKLYVQLEKTRKDGGVGASSTIPGNLHSIADDSWKRIWKLPCPRNIQMFTWRLKHESLALRTTVARRGIPIEDTKCLFCSRGEEDGAHLFIKCKLAKEVWRDLALEKERSDL